MLQGTRECRLKGVHPEGLLQKDTGAEVTGSLLQGVDGEPRKEHEGEMRIERPEGCRDVEAIVFIFEEPIGQEHVRCEGLSDRHGILGIGGYAHLVPVT